ncbi:uncharacterized protein [Dermacentor albipictus]|uniref:uncharacterized protein isoform X5 n=1 Tax=Dermacentor albipictus TaxID=60249 RepID=UPI0031FCDC37
MGGGLRLRSRPSSVTRRNASAAAPCILLTAKQEPPTGVQPGIARGRGVRTDAVGHRFRSHLTSDARGMPEIWDCGAY